MLRFIPVSNLFTVFCWLGVGMRRSTDWWRDLMLPWLKLMLGCAAVCVLGAVAMHLCPHKVADLIINFAMIYAVFLILAIGAVRAQERILRQWEERT